MGRLWKITDNMPATAKETDIDHDQDTGAMVKVTLPNGTVATLEYDDLGRLTHLVNAKSDGGAIITSYAYHYDEDAISGGLGLVDRIGHEDGRFDTFAYDAHERLTTEHYKAQDGTTLYRFDYTYDDDGNRTEKKYDYDPQTGTNKIVWFSDETDRTTVDQDFGPSNQLKRMWTQGSNTTGTKHTVCGSFTEANIDSIEVVSKTTGDTEVDSVTAQIRDGLFIARALNFFDGSNLATKATATATDKAGNTAADTNTGVEIDTTLDVWYTYDADGRREYKYEAGSYDSGDPFTHYYWNQAGYLKQVDIDYGTGESPRYARAWLTWDPTGDLAKLEIRTGSVLDDLTPGSGGTLEVLDKYTYFGSAVIVEREEVGDPSEKRYIAVSGKYLYQVDASDVYWYYHYDAGGSVTAITDSSKTIKCLYEYDSFGNTLANAGTVDNAFGFYGGTLIERLGLVHGSGLRFIEPASGARIPSSGLRNNDPYGGGHIVLVLSASALGIVCLSWGRMPRRLSVALLFVGVAGLVVLLLDASTAEEVKIDLPSPDACPTSMNGTKWGCCTHFEPFFMRAFHGDLRACVLAAGGRWTAQEIEEGESWEDRIRGTTPVISVNKDGVSVDFGTSQDAVDRGAEAMGGSSVVKGTGKLTPPPEGGLQKVAGPAAVGAAVGLPGYQMVGGLITMRAYSVCLSMACTEGYAPRCERWCYEWLGVEWSEWLHCDCPKGGYFLPIFEEYRSSEFQSKAWQDKYHQTAIDGRDFNVE